MAPHPRKTLIFNILNILKQFTDDNHTLSQADIVKHLRYDYGMIVDRKSIRRNIEELIDMGYDIQYREISRRGKPDKNGVITDATIYTDYHLVREFTDSELRLMITSLMAARNIPHTQCREMIRKLEGLSSKYFHNQTTLITAGDNAKNINQELFETMEILELAMANNVQIRMNYADYQTDKKLHLRLSTADWNKGEPVKYRVSPYYIITNNARLYLIGASYSKKAWYLNFYRLDRIKGIELTSDTREPKENIEGIGKDFDITKFTEEHLYMLYSPTIHVKFRINKHFLGELFDMFTGPLHFSDETDKEVTVHAIVTEASMKNWASQFPTDVVILAPESLVNSMKESLHKAAENYESGTLQLKD